MKRVPHLILLHDYGATHLGGRGRAGLVGWWLMGDGGSESDAHLIRLHDYGTKQLGGWRRAGCVCWGEGGGSV